jgi:filamentous hemagglutinin family protein
MKRSKILLRDFLSLCRPMMVGLSSSLISVSIFANPVLNNVSSGQVTIQQAPNSTVINQSSQKAIINWQSFNIGAQESTHFEQPVGGVALNRINAANGASQIYGHLTATGQIILVNPAGIFFGAGSYVNVGGLIASTANISDHDFLNNYYHFANVPEYNGAIVNQGQIIAADHGLVALIGGAVSNSGLIQANMGQVALASGDAFTMSFAGNDLIGFTVDSGVTHLAKDKNGNTLHDGVSNNGKIYANGGQILISAKDAAGVLDHVINMSGYVEAKSVYKQGGTIIISGDPRGGVVRIASKIN